jgi:hypothetical protein
MGEKQEIAYVKRIVIAGQGVVLISILPVDHKLELGELLGWKNLFLVYLLSALNITVN